MSQAALFDEQPEPERPYWQDGEPSAGWSGTDTSRASEPVRYNAQQRAWLCARERGRAGVTWREVAEDLKVHHGTASGALSVLHQRGHIARLTETRGKCKVYVLTSLVGNRDTERPTKNRDTKELAKEAWFAALNNAGVWTDSVESQERKFEEWWGINT